MARFRNVCRLLWGWLKDITPVAMLIGVLVFGLNVAADWNAARKANEERKTNTPTEHHQEVPKAATSATLLVHPDVLSHRNPVLWI
jgi:hypothetical protein